MLIKDEELEKRLNNPLNLLNRLKNGLSPIEKKSGMDLFIKKNELVNPNERQVGIARNNDSVSVVNDLVEREVIPLPNGEPKSDELINDNDAKIKLALAHDSALELLTNSIESLKRQVTEGSIKASSMPSIISSASRVITDIRKERLEREKNTGGNENVHYHFYCPTPKPIEEYEVIEVS